MSERRTRQLEATYTAVRSARDHPTAEQVHARVRRQVAGVSLGTVYRNLQKLSAQGRIRVLHLGRRSTRFDGMLEGHDHFVCDQCGALTDLTAPSRALPDVSPLRRAGYGVERHALTFFGICPQCRNGQRPARQRAAHAGR